VKNTCVICHEVKECPYFVIQAGADQVYDNAGDICQDCYDRYLSDVAQSKRAIQRRQATKERGEVI
jgi:hypothetical protein